MKRIVFLSFIVVLLSCQITLADVVTLWDGSVFEGSFVGETDDGKTFSVDGGTVFMYFVDLVAVEKRPPTEAERAKLVRFKTERYDLTNESDDFLPFEEEVITGLYATSAENQDMSDHDLARLVGGKFNVPPIIVELIMEKEFWLWF
jgi:hypothetical protein